MTTETKELETAPQASDTADEIDALIAADEAAEPESSLSSKQPGTQAPGGEQTPSSSTEQPSSKSGTPAATDKDKQTDPAKTDTDPSKSQQTPQSEYEKAKAAGRDREAKAWQRIEQQKAELEARQRFLDQREAQIGGKPAGQQQSTTQHTKAEYTEASRSWKEQAAQAEAQGKFEDADRLKALAAAAEEAAKTAPEKVEAPAAAPAAPGSQMTSAQFAQLKVQQQQSWDAVKKEIPELSKPDSEMAKEVATLLQGDMNGALLMPKGPAYVARFVAAKRQAARVPDLEKTVAEQKARIAELTAATTPGGGGGGPASVPTKAFEDMSLEEQENELRRELEG